VSRGGPLGSLLFFMQLTYILENFEAHKQRRYYVGRTINLKRRLKEHKKDKYKNYKLVYVFYANLQVEKELKKFGVTKFMNLSEFEKFELLEMFVEIKKLKQKK
jgi:predicted GIY-YIG superfamily endonuclease